MSNYLLRNDANMEDITFVNEKLPILIFFIQDYLKNGINPKQCHTKSDSSVLCCVSPQSGRV